MLRENKQQTTCVVAINYQLKKKNKTKNSSNKTMDQAA
jgi:hypothetical protein